MKKIGSLAIAALMVTALSISASAANSFEAAAGTPVIDGVMDDAYLAAEEISIDVVTLGDGNTTGTARVLWDADNIYVFFDIADPVLSEAYTATNCYETDSVEFFFDLSGTPGDITTINAGQYTAPAAIPNASADWSGRGMHWDNNKADATFKSVITDAGYTVEMQIPWGSDYTPKADAAVQVAFHINSDEDGKDGREGEIFAGENQSNAWSESNSYDKLTLTTKKYEPPVEETETVGGETSAQTADMGIIAALASLAASGAAVLSLKKRK